MAEVLSPGAEIGGYRILSLLGRGGMGLVYEAEHTILGRRAALKMLTPDLASEADFRERFIRESQLVAALDHLSIIPIYEAGEDDGAVYLAMRHVSGGDLQTEIGKGPMDPHRALEIVDQVASALDAAHDHGLVHRDVKPANVLLDASGRAYLSDFGIAKMFRSKGITPTGHFVGTLDYASPEQIRGEAIGPSSDIYAFACLLFECLTARKPFDRETDVAVMHAHLVADRPLVTSLRPDVPRAFDEVLARALAVDSSDRFSSCSEFVEAMRGSLGGRAVALRPAPPSAATVTGTRLGAGLTNFPAELTPLLGRGAEVAAIVELVQGPNARLVTLTGLGGTGKTRLAAAVGRTLGGALGQAFFVDLAPIADPELVGSTVAKIVGVDERSESTPLEAVTRRLAGGPALIVLDNFEQVLPAAAFVRELLDAIPGLTVLATSQAALRLRGELEFPVQPLSLPGDGADATSVAGSAAVELFVDRGRAVRPDFALTDENAATVAAICIRLDGLPLAIELAAARVKLLPPRAILERLEQRGLELLTGGASDLPARQRTLRDAIDWSYNLLEPREQALLARLGVFAGGCSLEAADAICGDGAGIGDVLDAIASLVDKSLVRQRDGVDGEPRFGLYETIRAYALGRLEEQGELEELRRRHAERCLTLAESAEPELVRANQTLWLQRLDEEYDNIRGALAWANGAGEHELALRIASALPRFWSSRGLEGEGRRWLAEALAGAGDISPVLASKATFAAGYTELGEGGYAAARTFFERSLELAREAEAGEAPALAQLAWLTMAAGELDSAQELAERSVGLASAADDKLTSSGALGTLAEVAFARGDYNAASGLFERSLALRRAIGDRRLTANSLLGLGRVALLAGRLDDAMEALEQAYGLGMEQKDTWITSIAMANLGAVHVYRREATDARRLLGEALELAHSRNDRRVEASCTQALGAVCAIEGRPQEAIQLFAAAERLRESTGGVASPVENAMRARFLEPLVETGEPGSFDAAWEAGRALEGEEIRALSLASARPSAATVVAEL